jgi:protein-S-isoprenylcysteine O-methyltransferase Ste14
VEIQFRIATGVLLALLFTIRIYHHRLALRTGGSVEEFESRANLGVRLAAALLLFGTLGAWLAGADWIHRASFPLPAWLRWLGALIGFIGLAGLFQVHRTLGRNFSGNLHLRADHELVVAGPYQYVRHPMYTTFYFILTAIALLTANWLLGAGGIIALTGVMLSRVKHEEEVMLLRFGDQYRQYMARTGRFLPRV